ncbi:MAG: hypothetical protein U0V74_04540 [Chitinophagales bacterium]
MKTLTLGLIAITFITLASCKRCSNCYVPIPEIRCFKGEDTIFYAFNTLGISDTIAIREAEGYTLDTTAFYIAINNKPICGKELGTYETMTGVTCKEIE